MNSLGLVLPMKRWCHALGVLCGHRVLYRTYKLLVDGSGAAFRCHVRALELLEGVHDLHHVDCRSEQILIKSANL